MPPKDKSKGPLDATAAIAEVDGEKPDGKIDVPFNGHVYRFRPARFKAGEFRLPLQQGRYMVALQWLIGDDQMVLFLANNAGEDGTGDETITDFFGAISSAVGLGNS